MTNVARIPNAYDQGRVVEQRGLDRLRPWLDKATDRRWVWIAKNGLAELIQRAGADIIIAGSPDKDWALDCKFIESATSIDAPFERWSNLVLMPGISRRDFEHARWGHDNRLLIDHRASNPGWGMTSRADLILVYNLSSDRGVIGRLTAWRELLVSRFESGLPRWVIWKLREQGKRRQPNSSWVIWTPYSALVQRAGFQLFNARQLGFWDRPELTLELIAGDHRING